MATILIVDDNADTRELLEAMLARAGHRAVHARDGYEAVRLYRTHLPDAVLLDIFMPGRDGIDTLLDLREEFPDVRAIAISAGWKMKNLEISGEGYDIDVLEHARTAGAVRAIRKPIDLPTLLSVVDEVLSVRR